MMGDHDTCPRTSRVLLLNSLDRAAAGARNRRHIVHTPIKNLLFSTYVLPTGCGFSYRGVEHTNTHTHTHTHTTIVIFFIFFCFNARLR